MNLADSLLQNPLNGRPASVALVKRASCNPQSFSPLEKLHRSAVERQNDVVPLVSRLNFSRRPYAVFRRVVAIGIVAFEGHSRIGNSHVCEERFKCPPPLGDTNSAPSVVREPLNIRVIAAPHHGAPDPVNACFRHAVPRRSGPHGGSASCAPTRVRISAPKVSPRHGNTVSTMANATPPRRNTSRSGHVFGCRELPKPFAGLHRVSLSSHGALYGHLYSKSTETAT